MLKRSDNSKEFEGPPLLSAHMSPIFLRCEIVGSMLDSRQSKSRIVGERPAVGRTDRECTVFAQSAFLIFATTYG